MHFALLESLGDRRFELGIASSQIGNQANFLTLAGSAKHGVITFRSQLGRQLAFSKPLTGATTDPLDL